MRHQTFPKHRIIDLFNITLLAEIHIYPSAAAWDLCQEKTGLAKITMVESLWAADLAVFHTVLTGACVFEVFI
jgi:hypothetical protein